MSDRKTTVVVVDDHAVVREGIRRVLERGGFEVVAEGGDGEAALELVDAHDPDVLVVDVAMPGITGIETTRQLTERGCRTRVLVLSMYDEPQYVLASIRAGAAGYILKDAPPADLRAAVARVAAGDRHLPESLEEKARLAESAEEQPSALELLTPRERDVLRAIAEGLTNKETAARHGISPRTVETHREALMRKLGVRTVAGLTRLALREGITHDG